MIGSLLQPEFEELIRTRNFAELSEVIKELDPPDVAELIADLPAEQEGVIFRVLPRAQAAAVFSYLPQQTQEQLIQSLGNDVTHGIVSEMTPDDRARLLEELPGEVTQRLLTALSPADLKKTRDLLGYAPETVGRYMTPEYAAVPATMTAAQAIEHIRRTGRGKETLNVVYITGDHGRLLQDVRLGTLVMARADVAVADINDRALVSVGPNDPVDSLVGTFEKYDRVALPVVDSGGVMLGIVTVDDVLEFAQRQATKEIQNLGGSEALDAPYFDTGFWAMCRKRGGWLAVLFFGEMLTATAMGHFEHAIEKTAVLALFIPLIISSGGNSGSQGTSLIIRSLALGEVKLRDWWRVFGRELKVGLALGVILGFVGLLRIAAWQGLSHVPGVGPFFQSNGESTAYGPHWLLLGWVVMFSLIGVIAWGALAGSMLPFILRRLNFDPATSSAPFVATLVDVTGLIIYFSVASLLLRGTLL